MNFADLKKFVKDNDGKISDKTQLVTVGYYGEVDCTDIQLVVRSARRTADSRHDIVPIIEVGGPTPSYPSPD